MKKRKGERIVFFVGEDKQGVLSDGELKRCYAFKCQDFRRKSQTYKEIFLGNIFGNEREKKGSAGQRWKENRRRRRDGGGGDSDSG